MFDLLAVFHPHPAVETAVRATLADGQVLMGEVHTRVLRLATGAGVVDVPLAHVGEVLPVSSEGLQVGEGLVNVWLRNGSELRGRWSDPRLAMGIAVGGNDVPVDLPMNELTRFQLQGGEAWPQGPVYRMKTTWGDDFLVDAARTHLVVENQLGSFEPSLAECQSLAPIGDPEGDWRIALATGTVLIGKLRDESVTVSLPLGPEQMTIPLANFVSLKLETWGRPEPQPLLTPPVRDDGWDGNRGAPAQEDVSAAPASSRPAGRAQSQKASGWFDSATLDETKDAQGQ